MKLVFYSGGYRSESVAIDENVLRHLNKKKLKITYIPSSSFDHDDDFVDFCRQYEKFNINKILNFPIDRPADKVIQKYAFESDIIHLSGGNTFYFLYHLRKRGYLQKLKEYVAREGVLTGLSAGAILMTPNITTASFPSFDRDENTLGVKSYAALGLVDFEFFPHFTNSKRYSDELARYSEHNKRNIYACADGSGIFVNDNNKTFYGKIYCFSRGNKLVI